MKTASNYSEMSPREAVKFAEFGTAFPKGFTEVWVIDSVTFSHGQHPDAVKAGKAWAKQMRDDGWTTKRHTNSLACFVTAVKRRSEHDES